MRLACDLGGTKVLLALVDDAGGLHEECRLASADFPDFTALLGHYLGEVRVRPEGGCCAVAGPVAADGCTARITNLPWLIDTGMLEAHFGIGRLRLINDFAGAALGIAALAPGQFETLQAGTPEPQGVRLVIGAGTGLGMAMLIHDGTDWRVLPGEGGHIAFAPADTQQQQIWSALHAEYGRVTCERVISGPGLVLLHRILAGKTLDAAAISAAALAGDAEARGSLHVFLAAYGAFAGDMALATLARGGVYLAGGIAAKVLPLLRDDPFLDAFNAKAEHAELAAQMPVHVVTDDRLGLLGAAAHALKS